MEYVNTFPRPPSVNSLFVNNPKTGGRFPSGAYKKWKETAGQYMLLAPRPEIKGKVIVMYEFGRELDKRRRDLANMEKGTSDLLVEFRIIEDDSLIEEMVLRWTDQVAPGMVKVYVSTKD